jgi:hypothetical protein
LFTAFGKYGDRFAIVANQNAREHLPARGLKRDPIPDFELEHLGVRPHLLKKAQVRAEEQSREPGGPAGSEEAGDDDHRYALVVLLRS